MTLRAPFPWFGGKSRVASIVWPRFGDIRNYVEPFAGSLAVLLARPTDARVETVNDANAYLANFWRALAHAPDEVAYYADWPVNEADLHARHRWLVESASDRVARVMADPDFFDAKVAGWWVWGQCLWIGSGWCQRPEWKGRAHCGRSARGLHANGTNADYNTHDDDEIWHEVRDWAIANGDNPQLRIALCGYEGDHAIPDSWDCVSWKASGGYGRSARGKANRERERIWFSPHCLPAEPHQHSMDFEEGIA